MLAVKVSLERLATLDLPEVQDLQVSRDLLGSPELLVPLGQLVLQVAPVPVVLQVLEELQDLVEQPGKLVTLETLVQLELRDSQGMPDKQVELVFQVQLEALVRLEILEIQVLLERLVSQVQLELLELLATLELQAIPVPLVPAVPLVLSAQQVVRVQQEIVERLEQQVNPESWEQQDHQDLLVVLVRKAPLVNRGRLETLGPWGLKEAREQRDRQEHQGRLVARE